MNSSTQADHPTRYLMIGRRASLKQPRGKEQIEKQKAQMRAHAKRHGGVIIKELGSQGRTNQSDLREALKSIESREADGIICTGLEILGRNPIIGAQFQSLAVEGKLRSIIVDGKERVDGTSRYFFGRTRPPFRWQRPFVVNIWFEGPAADDSPELYAERTRVLATNLVKELELSSLRLLKAEEPKLVKIANESHQRAARFEAYLTFDLYGERGLQFLTDLVLQYVASPHDEEAEPHFSISS